MPEKTFFGKLILYVLLGLVTIALTSAVLFFVVLALIPYAKLMAMGMIGIILLITIAFFTFIAIYIALFVGIFMRYVFKSMNVSKVNKKYAINSVKEAGRRKKGK
ncbi:MAG: hypothetical protein ISS36_00925 [Candidatus Aenigmarchaeota archaeon]|nr:hypothetical protein [Candidatus Aenigmarchaeota archaeon]